MELERGEIDALLPLALGHDQDASACPWVQLTHRTADYPSRKAQAALAVAAGAVPITPDLVDLLYRCDGCGRCRAWSTLPDPPDLASALWTVRSSLVATGAVPEVAALAELYRSRGSVYGDLGPAFSRLGPGDDGADVLFVPGAAMLFYAPEAAAAALRLARMAEESVSLAADLVDSGQELLELGLVEEVSAARGTLRRRIAEEGYRLVLAGTPKEAFGLRDALAGLAVDVRYVGTAVATAAINGRLSLPALANGGLVVFHPSEMLLHRLDGFDVVDRWLAVWLGERYRSEADPRLYAWPAAIERPTVRVREELSRALAERRLAQLAAGLNGVGRGLILTCDPWSWQALRNVAPPEIEVVDLLVLADGGHPGTVAYRRSSIEEGDTTR